MFVSGSPNQPEPDVDPDPDQYFRGVKAIVSYEGRCFLWKKGRKLWSIGSENIEFQYIEKSGFT